MTYRERNSIDWFQTALQADQNKMSLALQMEQLELQRRHHNDELGYKWAVLNQGSGYLGGGAPGGGYSAGGDSMFNSIVRKSAGPSQSSSSFTPAPQTQKNSVDSWGKGIDFKKYQ